MENNLDSFKKDLENSTIKKKFNRREYRSLYGGKRGNLRSNAPRHIASRRPKPMPENWKGWKDWSPKKKVV